MGYGAPAAPLTARNRERDIMPNDQAPRSSVDQALLHSLLGRVLMVGDKAHLASRSLQAVQLLLPAGADEAKRAALSAKINAIMAALPEHADPVLIHKAAEACAQLMGQLSPDREATAAFTAKAILATQPIATAQRAGPGTVLSAQAGASAANGPGRAAAAHAGPGHHAPAAGHAASGLGARSAKRVPAKPHEKKSPLLWTIVALLAIAAAVGGTLFFYQGPKGDVGKRPLVAQFEAAAKGSVPASNIFGGSVKVSSQGGHLLVTMSGVPAGECISSGWDLTHSGVLTVNGVTPIRVSAAILNELCHNDDPATMVWSPKPQTEPPR